MPSPPNNEPKFLDPMSHGTPHDWLLPLFDRVTGLPVKELLPELLDRFYDHYADNYLFLLNRNYLKSLLEQGKASTFLICVMSALSSRFCSPDTFTSYLPPKPDGSERKVWELSTPFLERAKILMISALDLPSPEVVVGLLMMAFVDFGNKSEAGKAVPDFSIRHLISA